MADYVYTDHAQYTIKTYAKMALFPLVLLGGYISTLLLTLVGLLVKTRKCVRSLKRQHLRAHKVLT